MFIQGRSQDFFQGVEIFLEISSGGGDNLPGGGDNIPGGWRTNFEQRPPPQRFASPQTIPN